MQANKHSYGYEEKQSVIELFFQLIRCGIGKQDSLLRLPNENEWRGSISKNKLQ